jgi:hypothetical protein
MSSPRFSDVHETDVDAAQAHTTPSVRLDHAPRSGFALRMHAVTRGPLSVEETRCTDGLRMLTQRARSVTDISVPRCKHRAAGQPAGQPAPVPGRCAGPLLPAHCPGSPCPPTLSGHHNTALSYARVAIAVDGVAMADRVGLTLARRDASSATRCARGPSVATTGKYQPVIEVR